MYWIFLVRRSASGTTLRTMRPLRASIGTVVMVWMRLGWMGHFSRLRLPSDTHMTTHWKPASRAFALSCFCLALLQPLAAQRHDVDVAVVVHPDTPVSNLSLSDVRKVFLGDRQYWSTNIPVVLLIRAPVARERDVVLKIIYQMSESQFKQYWIAKIFRAEAATAPKG